jgi:hypothetical protein
MYLYLAAPVLKNDEVLWFCYYSSSHTKEHWESGFQKGSNDNNKRLLILKFAFWLMKWNAFPFSLQWILSFVSNKKKKKKKRNEMSINPMVKGFLAHKDHSSVAVTRWEVGYEFCNTCGEGR